MNNKMKQFILGWIYTIIGQREKIVPKKVLFFTFQGTYTCNPKYICEKIKDIDPQIELVWVTLSDKTEFPEVIRTVKFGSIDYYKALYSSKVLVENAFNFAKRPFLKRKPQFVLQTMHGSLGIKKIDVGSNYSFRRNSLGFISAKSTDYIISNSTFEDSVYRTSFWKTTPILKIGHARNDILFDEEKKIIIRNKVRAFYRLEEDIKICLYAPTYMRSETSKNESIDFDALREALSNRFGGSWIILNRMHPRDKRADKVVDTSNYVLDGNLYEDIQELMVAADFGITDYSSWIYDFVLSRKPGAIFASDVEEYSSSTGFYYPITETPFVFSTSNKELFDKIIGFSMEDYKKKVDEFIFDKGCIDDGFSADRAAEIICNLISSNTIGEKFYNSIILS